MSRGYANVEYRRNAAVKCNSSTKEYVVGNDTLSKFFEDMSKRTDLKSIDLTKFAINDEQAKSLALVIDSNKELTKLVFDMDNLTKAGIDKVFEAVEKNESLKKNHVTIFSGDDCEKENAAGASHAQKVVNARGLKERGLTVKGSDGSFAAAKKFWADAVKNKEELNDSSFVEMPKGVKSIAARIKSLQTAGMNLGK